MRPPVSWRCPSCPRSPSNHGERSSARSSAPWRFQPSSSPSTTRWRGRRGGDVLDRRGPRPRRAVPCRGRGGRRRRGARHRRPRSSGARRDGALRWRPCHRAGALWRRLHRREHPDRGAPAASDVSRRARLRCAPRWPVVGLEDEGWPATLGLLVAAFGIGPVGAALGAALFAGATQLRVALAP